MTLTEQLEAALRRKAADDLDLDTQVAWHTAQYKAQHTATMAFLADKREIAMREHDKIIAGYQETIQAHKDIIGEAS